MRKIRIRTATPEDFEGCYEVESTCFTSSEAASFEMIKKRIETNPAGFFVAQTETQIAAIMHTTKSDSEDLSDESLKKDVKTNPSGKNTVVISLAVKEEFRGNNIAAKLLEKLIKESHTQSKILLICKQRLITFYEKFGFSLKQKSKSKHGGYEWYEMELHLRKKNLSILIVNKLRNIIFKSLKTINVVTFFRQLLLCIVL